MCLERSKSIAVQTFRASFFCIDMMESYLVICGAYLSLSHVFLLSQFLFVHTVRPKPVASTAFRPNLDIRDHADKLEEWNAPQTREDTKWYNWQVTSSFSASSQVQELSYSKRLRRQNRVSKHWHLRSSIYFNAFPRFLKIIYSYNLN